jgi:hypothetical protein
MMGGYGPRNPSFWRERGVRKVLRDYDQCAGVWAAQSQREGKTSGGRMFFEDATLYSYGYHFPLAHIYTDKDTGANIVLVNSDSYSKTTSRQQGATRSAVTRHFSEAAIFYVPTEIISAFMQSSPTSACGALFNDDLDNARRLWARAQRARSRRDEHVRNALHLLQRSNRIAEFMRMKKPFALSADTASDAIKFALALLGDKLEAEYLVKQELSL